MNVSDFHWDEMPANGDRPLPRIQPVFEYYQENLYLATGFSENCDSMSYLYLYSLKLLQWSVISDKKDFFSCRSGGKGLVHDDHLFVFFGWDYEVNEFVTESLKINLKAPTKVWEKLKVFPSLIGTDFSLTKVKNSAYFFGGFYSNLTSRTNRLNLVDLESFQMTEISEKIIFPKQRSLHSLTLINSKLYLFGGVNNENLFNDVWTFDILTSRWTQVPVKGTFPSPRYSHAAGSEGSAFVVWGGKDKDGLKHDMFLFNSITETWTELLTFSNKPSPAKGACLVIKELKVYLFGGITDSSISNELWEYNLGTNAFSIIAQGKDHLAYSHCWIKDQAFYVSLGSTFLYFISTSISFFNLTTKTWHNFHFHNLTLREMSQSVQLFIDDHLITIGGHQNFYDSWNEISILGKNNKKKTIQLDLDVYLISSTSAYFNKSLYIFGGGANVGGLILPKAGNNRLFELKVEEICENNDCQAFCSSGTKKNGKICEICPPGSYAEGLGNEKCSKCRPGSFNEYFGSSSSSECLPCPEGTFNNKSGAGKCEDCPNLKNCPIGSVSYSEVVKVESGKSIQPPLFKDPDMSKNLLIYQILVSVPLFLLLILIISVKKMRDKLHLVDMFDEKHDNPECEYMIKKKTKIGGAFTFIFVIGALLLTCTAVLQYLMSNIQESKGLVTLVVLESEVLKFKSDLQVQITLNSYGGQCESDSKCLQTKKINFTNIEFSEKTTSCKLIDNHSCRITIGLKHAVIDVGANIALSITESRSYSSGVKVNLTSSSSIPDQISSVSSLVEADANFVFIGSIPSEFYFLATPSLFKSESSQWESDLTGYHISEKSSPKPGNQYRSVDLSLVSYLHLKIFIEKSSTGLITQRNVKQTFVFFAGSLLGTVSGLFGVAGFFMAFVEKKIKDYVRKYKKKYKDDKVNSTDNNERTSKVIDLTDH